MKVYVAGSSQERERVRAAMDAVRSIAGAELTHDWLAEMERVGVSDTELPHAERAMFADADLRAIDDAEVLWFLIPETESRGAWFELGYAYCWARTGYGKAVVMSGPGNPSIFGAKIAWGGSDADVLAWIRVACAMGGEKRGKR